MTDPICRDALGRGSEQYVLIPAGSFKMGSDKGAKDEQPVHEVFLDAYCLSKYEATEEEWKKFKGEKVRFEDYEPKQPMGNINWDEAREFCKWLGGDLPTEARWEKGAKGGKNFDFATPDGIWTQKNPCLMGGTLLNVNACPPNPFGLHGMSGNVWEWVLDSYGESVYTSVPVSNPVNIKGDVLKVMRGGSSQEGGPFTRTSHRHFEPPDYSSDETGVRCALNFK